MNNSRIKYDVIVVGGGHAGIEAALAVQRMNCSTVLVTAKYNRIGEMSCNPAIGGIAKGTIVREIDALDGSMGKSADITRLQFRMLNRRKGPAVWGPRVQSDAYEYADAQRRKIESSKIEIIEDEVVALKGGTERVDGVLCRSNGIIRGRFIVLAMGTFLGGRLFRGYEEWRGGRIGDIAADSLDKDLRKRMFHVERFKTGTPPRVVQSTVDTGALEIQSSEETDFKFSFEKIETLMKREICYVTKTNSNTMKAAKDNLHHSPLMAGRIEGTGPRYCPSYEDKVVKFPDREHHNIYVEPMGYRSRLFYLNGLSSSLPREAQDKMVRSLPGFSEAVIAEYGYAVEYSYFHNSEITNTLRLKKSDNIFVAGQICGTSGYEEAAGLGLLAGANAARSSKGVQPQHATRMDSYLGVMVDDIVSKGIDEPYRLFSSRAENRLHIRQDNANRRLYAFGLSLGVLSGSKAEILEKSIKEAEEIYGIMNNVVVDGITVSTWCRRPGMGIDDIIGKITILEKYDRELLHSVMLDEKYKGYIRRSLRRNESRKRASEVSLGVVSSYMEIKEICWEAREALEKEKPATLAEAERISGVRPTDLCGLLLYIAKKRST